MITKKSHLKSITLALHKAMKAKPNMKLSEFREEFSKAAGLNDWNAALASLDASGESSTTTIEHVAAMAFKSEGEVEPKHFNFPDYVNDNNFELLSHTLAPHLANKLIELFYDSEYWFLAPMWHSVFNSKAEALSFVFQFPGHPISLVLATNSESDVVSVTGCSNDKDEFYILDETLFENFCSTSEELRGEISPISTFDNINGLKSNLTKITTAIMIDETKWKDAYSFPYITKGHHFKKYISCYEYAKSEDGMLTKLAAIRILELFEGSLDYHICKLDGSPFTDHKDALLFVKTFNQHSLGIRTRFKTINDDTKVIITNDESCHYVVESVDRDDLITMVAKDVRELKSKLPAFFEAVLKKEHPYDYQGLSASII